MTLVAMRVTTSAKESSISHWLEYFDSVARESAVDIGRELVAVVGVHRAILSIAVSLLVSTVSSLWLCCRWVILTRNYWQKLAQIPMQINTQGQCSLIIPRTVL